MINPRFPRSSDEEVDKLTVSLYDYANDVNTEFSNARKQTPQVDAFAVQATTSGGGAFAWRNPYTQTILVTRVVIHIQAISGAPTTLDVGTATGSTTPSGNLINALDVSSSAGAYDNITDMGATGSSRRVLNQNEYVTGTLTGAPSGLKANCYIEYYFTIPVL